MSRITGVVVALATAAAVLTGSTAGAGPGAAGPPTVQLPREVTGGVELTLADGDLLRVWAAANHRTVWSKRYDAASRTWDPRTVVLERRNLFCGDVEARTANGAVAVLAECDRNSWSEDQAPTASRALWTADTVNWVSYELPGEAYEEPGISPDGRNAVWPLHQGYVTKTAAGFVAHRIDADDQEYTVTATITDAEQVSFLYGGAVGRGRCALVALTRTGDAVPVRQEIPLADACSDSSLANVDAETVLFGDPSSPAHRTVVSRPAATSPWAVTAIAPASAPGLFQTWRAIDQDFHTAPGLPLVALGSADRRSVQTQVYDPVSQTWQAPTTVFTSRRRCTWADNWTAEPLSVLAAGLVCGRRNGVVLTTQDGVTWRAVRGDWNRRGLSPDGTYVALPARDRTYVLSPERGVVTLAGGVPGRCDVVVPDGPDGAVLLTSAGRHRGWPTVLQHSSSDGWDRLSRTSLPTPPRSCTAARASTYDLPYRFDIVGGRDHRYTVRIVRRDGAWTVRRSRY